AVGLPIAAKVRNSPRFAEVDVPVLHVPGALETMQRKTRPKKPRKVSAVRGRPSPTSPTPSPAETQRDAAAEARWLALQEIIRRHKAEGRPGPHMLAAIGELEAAAPAQQTSPTSSEQQPQPTEPEITELGPDPQPPDEGSPAPETIPDYILDDAPPTSASATD